MTKIGFATEFFTLWDVNTEPVYFTDERGNTFIQSYKTNYWYIKNISTDRAKVEELFPGVEIDEELRGQGSFVREDKNEDLCPEIFKFGKYRGKTVAEIIERDFNYIMWIVENNNSKTAKYCIEQPEVIEFFTEQKRKTQELMDALPVVESGEVELTFTSNPNYKVYEGVNLDGMKYDDQIDLEYLRNNYYSGATIGEGNVIKVIFKDIRKVEGLYPYNMAFINGTATKTKDKTLKVNIEVLYTKKYRDFVEQIVIVK